MAGIKKVFSQCNENSNSCSQSVWPQIQLWHHSIWYIHVRLVLTSCAYSVVHAFFHHLHVVENLAMHRPDFQVHSSSNFSCNKLVCMWLFPDNRQPSDDIWGTGTPIQLPSEDMFPVLQSEDHSFPRQRDDDEHSDLSYTSAHDAPDNLHSPNQHRETTVWPEHRSSYCL